jgi:AMMECR1 domain-containing protein
MVAADHPFPPFPWRAVARPLRQTERAEVARALRDLLRFQRELGAFRAARAAPDATPFVSLYQRGKLRGCYGSDEGSPTERVTRAFLMALHDRRFGGVDPGDRAALVAQLSYVRRPRLINPETAPDELEAGTHGVALVLDRGPRALLLPHVARDERAGGPDLLRALARKMGLPDDRWKDGALYAFETEDLVVRPMGAREPRAVGAGAAAAWLASLVAEDGAVTFAIDPRAGRAVAIGEMHHGRAAVLVQALAASGRAQAAPAERARRRLDQDLRAALSGSPVAGWPADPELAVATLALAVRAGVPLTRELRSLVEARSVPRTAWHAAQVVAALGSHAPEPLFTLCVEDLERRPFAPWTLLAAQALGDPATAARTARALATCIRDQPPYAGGASITPVPETALTAVAIEGLADHPAPWARAAVARGRSFLARRQLLGARIYGALDPAACHGAFAASPIADALRCDITAHAVLALAGGRRRLTARAS